MNNTTNNFRVNMVRYTPGKLEQDAGRVWIRYDGYTHFSVALDVPAEGEGFVDAVFFNHKNVRFTAELSFFGLDDGYGPTEAKAFYPGVRGALCAKDFSLFANEVRIVEDAVAEATRRFCNQNWLAERDAALKLLPPDAIGRDEAVEEVIHHTEDSAARDTGTEYVLTVSPASNDAEEKEPGIIRFATLREAIIEALHPKFGSRFGDTHFSTATVKRDGCDTVVFYTSWETGKAGTFLNEKDPDYVRVQPYLSDFGRDLYKVAMLEKMLEHETAEGETHYGAHLRHWWGDTKHLTIDAGGLRVLRDYYKTHNTNLG